MDIEVHYLRSDTGKRWGELDQDRQSSLLAYWMLQHSTKDERVMLSSPANYHDIIQGLMLSKGVRPKDVAGGKTSSHLTKGRSPMRRGGPQVKVVGGELTPSIEMVAEQFKRQGMPKHMVKRTGSDREAVDWLLSHRID